MVTFKYDFSLLFTLIKFVFLPVTTIVVLAAVIIFITSRKVKKENIKRYNYIVDFWTTLLAILIIGALFAVTIGFSLSLSASIKMYNLIKGHELIYYLVLITPIIPFIFLIGYIYRIIVIMINKPKKEEVKEEIEEYVPEPNNFNYVEDENNNEEIENSNEDEDELNLTTKLALPDDFITKEENGYNTDEINNNDDSLNDDIESNTSVSNDTENNTEEEIEIL